MTATLLSLTAPPRAGSPFTQSTEGVIAGPAGAYTINMKGGASTAGSGGSGGDFEQNKEGALGVLGIFNANAADASFTMTSATGYLGDEPLTVRSRYHHFPGNRGRKYCSGAANPTRLSTPSTCTGPRGTVYISDGDAATGDEPAVTGIKVNNGMTLTLESVDIAAGDPACVTLANDLDNLGTVTTAAGFGGARIDLNIDVDSYIASSEIDLSGNAAFNSGGDLDIDANGNIINHGGIKTTGFSDSGGAGGDVDLYADFRLENTGPINTDGADNTAGAGGDGGSIDLYSGDGEEGNLYNSGDMTTTGGDGTTAGGDGGEVDMDADPGSVLNSGDITTSGGMASAGDGGDGGDVYLYSDGADLFSSGDITTTGGAGSTDGGSGGAIGLYVNDVDSLNAGDSIAGDTLVSGNLDTSGGAGGHRRWRQRRCCRYFNGDRLPDQSAFDAARLRQPGYQRRRMAHTGGGSGGNVDLVQQVWLP